MNKILTFLELVFFIGIIAAIGSCQKVKADGSPEAPPAPPAIYVGETKMVGSQEVAVVTVNGKQFLVCSRGGCCPIN